MAIAACAETVFVQDREVFVHDANYDKDKIPSYTLEDPLVFVDGRFDSRWFDTEGEYLAVKAASPVWTFLGKGGMPDVAWPADYDTSAIGRHLGYVRRAGSHGLSAHDWTWLMDFADGVFRH